MSKTNLSLQGSRGQIDLPETAQLLTEGGDGRITLDGETGTNQYGCPPYPDPELLAFGSSTSSVISEVGFAAATRLRDELNRSCSPDSMVFRYAAELDRVRQSLIARCRLERIQGLGIIFGASGTDLHLFATHIVSESGADPLCAVMVDADETGSGVPLALSRRHYSNRSPLSTSVTSGSFVTGGTPVEVRSVAVRGVDGSPRSKDAVDRDFEARISQALAAGKRVLLVLVDVSKTGLISPSPECALRLKARYPGRVEVLVDACQFRIGAETLRAYLEKDCLVALTGSKFITGPAFCGALMVPNAAAGRLREVALAPALSHYSARTEWPEDWPGARELSEAVNFGLLLRWKAALADLSAFNLLAGGEVNRFLAELGAAISNGLDADPIFEPVAVPAIDRAGLCAGEHWDMQPTIFPFLLYREDDRGTRHPLTRQQTLQIYHQLFEGTAAGVSARCQLGQPVSCGIRGGIPVSALRLCASARLVVEGVVNGKQGSENAIDRALAVLENTAYRVRTQFR